MDSVPRDAATPVTPRDLLLLAGFATVGAAVAPLQVFGPLA
jgi:hypothetical protein